MRGADGQKARDVGKGPSLSSGPRRPSDFSPRGNDRDSQKRSRKFAERRESRMKARGASPTGMYRKRRFMAVGLVVLGAAALLFALLAPTTAASGGGDGRTVPIDPSSAGPDTVLATVGGMEVSTPIRPSALTGLGYHPEGETLAEMEPRGDNLSGNPLLALIPGGSTPESIRYHVMDSAGREGSRTGALDVGAPTETSVYSPVTGSITSIRPDPAVSDANVVEIQPAENPDLRISVSLVASDPDGAGVNSPVTAGETKLGIVADSAGVLDPQLAEYTGDAGNHVTVAVSNVG